MNPNHLIRLAALGAVSLALVACGQDANDAPGGNAGATTEQAAKPVSLTVYAAASLTDSFEQIATGFENANPGVDVVLSFDGSSTLVAQLAEGAPADVFASADQANMDKAVKLDLAAAEPKLFTANALTIAVPAGNPGGVNAFADLAKPGLRLVTCAEEVPCGALAAEAASQAGLELAPVSQEQNVKAVMAKLTSGEAEAGLVYATDVLAAGDAVQQIQLPAAAQVTTQYPVAVLRDAGQPALGQAFVDYLLSTPAQAVLSDAGFASLAG